MIMAILKNQQIGFKKLNLQHRFLQKIFLKFTKTYIQNIIKYPSNLLNLKTHIQNIITAKLLAFLAVHHIRVNTIIVASFVGLL